MNIGRTLITGGAGFIGSHTADALLAMGADVRILDNLDSQVHGPSGALPAYLAKEVEVVVGDVRDPDTVDRSLDGVDYVLHLAALTGVGQSMYDLHGYTDVNVTGTANVLERVVKAGIDLQRFVLASSRAVYGEGTFFCIRCGIVYPSVRRRADMEAGDFTMHCPSCGNEVQLAHTNEGRPLNPVSLYGWTKRWQEELCIHAARTFGLPVTILRYFNVYGSRQSLVNPYTGIVSIFYSRLEEEAPISIYENGQPVRDFVHVFDVARANVAALRADVPSGVTINVGTGRASRIGDVASELAAALGREPVLREVGEFRVGDIHSCIADTSRLSTLLGAEPGTSLAEGIREFVVWARNQTTTDLYDMATDELRSFGLFGSADSGGSI